jgi:hypothetical protein
MAGDIANQLLANRFAARIRFKCVLNAILLSWNIDPELVPLRLDLTGLQIVYTPRSHAAAQRAVEIARAGTQPMP